MQGLFIDTYYLSSVNINLMVDYYGTLENFPHFLEKYKIDVSCFAIQVFNLNIFFNRNFLSKIFFIIYVL